MSKRIEREVVAGVTVSFNGLTLSVQGAPMWESQSWIIAAAVINEFYGVVPSLIERVTVESKPCQVCAERAQAYEEQPPEETREQRYDADTIRHTLMVGGGRR